MAALRDYINNMIPAGFVFKTYIASVNDCISKFKDYWMGRNRSIALNRVCNLHYGFFRILDMGKLMSNDNNITQHDISKILKGYYILHRIDEKKFAKCLTIPTVKVVGEARHTQMVKLKKDADASYARLRKSCSWDKLYEKLPEICTVAEKMFGTDPTYTDIETTKRF